MNKIKTNRGDFYYTPIPLYYGRKTIDRDTCRDNLLDFKMLLDLKQIDFGIIFGTLLGAVREKNFIEYDEDVDVYILGERKQDFLIARGQMSMWVRNTAINSLQEKRHLQEKQ